MLDIARVDSPLEFDSFISGSIDWKGSKHGSFEKPASIAFDIPACFHPFSIILFPLLEDKYVYGFQKS